MKKVIAVGVLLASVLFTVQPAATADVPVVEPVASVETVITAPVVELPVVEPVVTTEAAPAPEPVVEVAPVAPAPVSVPAATAPVATAPVAPTVDPYSGNPIVDCEAQGLVTAEDATCVSAEFYAPEPVTVCHEDMPCWDCSTMGNRICGLDEAFALSGYADFGTFRNAYLGTYPIHTPNIGYRAVVSVINPAFQYVFAMTTPEICASLKLGDAWAGVSLTCGTPEVPAPAKGHTPEAPVIIPPHAEPGVEPEA